MTTPVFVAGEQLALWLKAKEIQALEKAKQPSPIKGFRDYWGGKAEGFANAWAYIVFDGRDINSGVMPYKYNTANEYWSEKAKEVIL